MKENKIDPFLADQLKRAILSIVLNIAEEAGRYSKNDKKNFYIMARGSTYESVSILRLLLIKNEIDKTNFQNFYIKLEEISKMLYGLVRSMIQNINKASCSFVTLRVIPRRGIKF